MRRRQDASRAACEGFEQDNALSDPVLSRRRFVRLDQMARLNGDLIRLQVEDTLRDHSELLSQEMLLLAHQLATAEDEGRLAQVTEWGRREVTSLMDHSDELIEEITVWMYLVQMIDSELADQDCERSIATLLEQDLLDDSRLTLAELHRSQAPHAPQRPLIRRDQLDRPRSSDDEAEKNIDPLLFADHGSHEDQLISTPSGTAAS